MDRPRDERLEPFVQMLTHLREPLLLVSRSGVILAGNVAAAEALGTTTDALVGTSLSAHTSEPGDLDARLLEALGGEHAVPLRTRDGHRFSCHSSLLEPDVVLLRLSGGPDPSTLARAFFGMFPRFDSAARSGAPATLEELARTMLPFGMSSVDAAAGGLHLLDENGQTLELIGSVGYREESIDRFRLVAMTTPIPLTDCVRAGRPIYLMSRDDYQTHYPSFLQQFPYIQNALVCVPLVIEGRCIGALGLGAQFPWHLGEADRTFLEEFAAQCALTLERTRRSTNERVHGDVEVAAERFERLHGFTGALARAITPGDVAEVAVDAGMVATGARSGGLWLVDDDGRSVSLVRSVGPTGPRPEHHVRVPLDRAARMPILDAIQSGAPVWLESCRQLEVRYPEAFAAFSRGGESSLTCVPLLAQGRCIGGLAFNFDRAHRFLEHERAFFQLITWYAAQALERSRLYAAEQRARSAAEALQRRSAFLAESDMLLATLDYQSILAAIASTAVPRIADWCIVELEEERLRGVPAVGMHVDPAKVPFVLALSARFRAQGGSEHGIPAVIRTGRSRLYRSITIEQIRAGLGDAELVELYTESGVVSSMVVPISARGTTLGAILLNSADPNRTYDEDDLAMAEELGRKVGLAVENARLYRDAREADRLKDEFLAMLSHELRNPLVPIVAAVDLMGLRDSRQFVEERGLIQRNAQHLVRLVDDLLDVSRITRGKIELSRQPCEVADLVRDAIDIAFPLVEERGHRLLIAAPRRGLAVFTDRVRIAQAIANLLTNAAKYTEDGGTITVTAEAEAANAAIRIRDTGIGIAPDAISHIFDIFVQGDRRKGGLGIGLTVVKRLVELHGGSVTAHSAGLGHGTELVILLPLTTAAVAVSASHAPRVMLPALAGKRALVVDDNHDAAKAIAELMDAIGFTTCIAHDAFAALEVATDFQPDLALLDLGLPEMDGYELARRLRAIYPSLRIVAVTGFGQQSDLIRSRDAGFDEHIVKPVSMDVLRRVVESVAATDSAT